MCMRAYLSMYRNSCRNRELLKRHGKSEALLTQANVFTEKKRCFLALVEVHVCKHLCITCSSAQQIIEIEVSRLQCIQTYLARVVPRSCVHLLAETSEQTL